MIVAASLRGGPFEAVQQLIDAGELGILVEQALLLEGVGHFRNHVAADAAQIGQRREDPDRRRTKRDDAEHFDRVAGSPPGQEVVGQRPLVGIDTFDAADLLDHEAERRVDEVLIQLAAADAGREGHLSHFARHAGAEPQGGSDDTLGERKKVRS